MEKTNICFLQSSTSFGLRIAPIGVCRRRYQGEVLLVVLFVAHKNKSLFLKRGLRNILGIRIDLVSGPGCLNLFLTFVLCINVECATTSVESSSFHREFLGLRSEIEIVSSHGTDRKNPLRGLERLPKSSNGNPSSSIWGEHRIRSIFLGTMEGLRCFLAVDIAPNADLFCRPISRESGET
jgi:hypothetical protein